LAAAHPRQDHDRHHGPEASEQAARTQLPPRRQGARHNSYRVKKPSDDGTRHIGPATIKLVNPVLTRAKISTAAWQNKLSGIGAYPHNLIHYNKLDRGGHFAAWEQPRLFSEEMRDSFRPLRK